MSQIATIPPPHFTHSADHGLTSTFLGRLEQYYPSNRRWMTGGGIFPRLSTGPYTYGTVTVWVELTESHAENKVYRFHYQNKEDEDRLFAAMKTQSGVVETVCNYKMYKWSGYYDEWRFDQAYPTKAESDLVGLESFMKTLDENLELMRSTKVMAFVGDHNLPLSHNYLLCGKPGTGKTSLIQAFCTKHELSMYRITSDSISEGQLEKIMHGLGIEGIDKIRVIILEDFDRCHRRVDQSRLLNALDGLKATSNAIRIFTANDSSSIKCNTGLYSRITTTFEFTDIGIPLYAMKLNNFVSGPKGYWKDRVFDKKETQNLASLCKTAFEMKISLRRFESFMLMHLFYDDFITRMLDKIHDLPYNV